MKFKPKKEDIYEIIGANEEISIYGVPKGALGALVVKSDDGTPFQVGSGFTREDRETLWKDVQSLTGKKVKVKYQHLTDRHVPRFPVFVEVIE
jgi:ATP-dependent DNA ligase